MSDITVELTTNTIEVQLTPTTVASSGGAVDSVNTQTGVVVLNQDDILDGATNKQYSQTEKTKLAGIATGATVNQTDAYLLDRINHTGTQAISTVAGLQTALDGKQNSLGFTPENVANKNIANGYAPLDGGGKVPLQNLPATLLKYVGVWNASTNTPTLTNPDLTKVGNVYNVSVAGTQFGINFSLGDWLIYNESGVPEKSDNSDDVVSVNGMTGAVTITKSDVGLDQVDNTTDLNKPISTATQTALNAKQDTLVSGTNIKTVNGVSILGAGNLSVSGVNYDQEAVPVSPLSGQIWRERTAGGLFVNEWEWTGTVWASTTRTSISLDSPNGASAFNSIGITTARYTQLPFEKSMAVQVVSSGIVSPTADASNRWDITFGFGTQQNAVFVTSVGSYSIDSTIVRTARIDTLSGISGSINENCIYAIATKVGSPSTITLGCGFVVREVRV